MKKIIIGLFLVLVTFKAASQLVSNEIIESTTTEILFADFVKDLEKRQAVRFFYESDWLDSVVVKRRGIEASLNEVLDESFKGFPVSYLIDGPNVIITRNYKVQASLPDDFFRREDSENEKQIEAPEILTSYISEQAPKKVRSKDKVVIGNPHSVLQGNNSIVSGTVRHKADGEPAVGLQVYIKELNIGTVTDANGFYALRVPKGQNQITFKSIGLEDTIVSALVYSNGSLNVEMKESAVLINEVVVTADRDNNLKNLNIGVQQLDIETIKQLPATLGEVDILKTALLLPGVQTVGEGASGFNVRGGSADQNLILFDQIPIFNTSHLFGFFSVFNPETVKDFKLYKSGIPASYGGRVSSVFDVQAKRGKLESYSLSGGISPVTSKLTIEGPVIKDRLSLIIGGRSTYSDWILRKIDSPQTRNSSADFWDLTTKLYYRINNNNELSITSYQSQDDFRLNSDTTYHYKNNCMGLFFKHYFSTKTYAKLSGIYSSYQYNITSDEVPLSSFSLDYNIVYKSLKAEVLYSPNTKHNFVFGSEVIKYDMTPGDFTPLSAHSDISEFRLPKEKGVETGLYISDNLEIGSRLSLSLGLRYASFFVLGPYKEYHYNPLVPKMIESRMDSTFYSNNEVVKTYGGPEIRFSGRYTLGLKNSIKLSYNRIHQFIHMLSNSTAVSPTDVWKISDPSIKPLIGDQIAVGYYHNLLADKIEASAEVYYKKTMNHLDYKSGTSLLLNPDLDVSLLAGEGRAYGLEVMLKKDEGKVNGWVSYTYSKSEIKINGRFVEERINNGRFYPSDYDKTHDFSLITNYKPSRRYSLSSAISYSTGRPISFPVAKYNFRNNQLMHYTNRNEYRIPDYFRWDISLNIFENLKSKKVVHNFWTIGVYNLSGRNNAYSVFFKSTSKGVKGYLLSVFSQPIVNVSYNFRF
jgi:hypothetical protein